MKENRFMSSAMRWSAAALLALLVLFSYGCGPPQTVVRPDAKQDALLRQGLDQANAGDTEAGLRTLEAAVEAATTPLEREIALAVLTSHQGRQATQAGRFDEAIALFEKSLGHQRRVGDPEAQAKTLTTIGNLHSYTGAYHQALDLYRQALVIEEKHGYRAQQARTLLSMAGVTLRLRDYGKGLDQANRAVQIAGRLGDEALAADARNVLGILYRDQGDYGAALDQYEKALSANLAAGRAEEAAQNRINIGEVNTARGDLVRAEAVLKEALSDPHVRDNPLWRAIVETYLGDVEFGRERFSEAAAYNRSALASFTAMKVPDRVARAELKLGMAAYARGDYSAALAHYERALPVYRGLEDRQWLAEALYRRGRAYESLGRLKEAERDYREAVDVFEQIRATVPERRALRDRYSELHAVIYEALVDLLMRTNRVEEAIRYVQRSQARALREMLERNGISAAKPRLRELLDRYRELSAREAELAQRVTREQSAAGDPQRIETLRQSLAATRVEFSQILEQIRREDADLYSLLAVKPEDLLRIVRQLPDDALPLAYFVTDKRLFIFFADRGSLQARAVDVDKDRLNALVERVRDLTLKNAAVDPGDWSDNGTIGYKAFVKPYKESLTELYRLLLEPIGDALARYPRLAVIPFGIVHYVPMHALAHEDESGRLKFVIEDHEVVYLLPTTLADQPRAALAGGELTISAFGDPDLGDPTLDLPSARQEVERIAALFPSAAVYTGRDATKGNFLKRWDETALIHVAAHGDLDPVQGPALLLAPAGTGRLGLSDITALPTEQRRPVVALSACQTALSAGERNPTGSEISSVAYAFSRAGAGGVVATLWVVDDVATAQLMDSVYRQVKSNSRLSYPLLRTAQLELLSGTGLHRQPFYWAPFIYYGLY